MKKITMTTKDFVALSIKAHGDRYGYDLAEYRGCHIPVKMICQEHGVFEQEPGVHYRGHGCPKCANRKCSQRKTI